MLSTRIQLIKTYDEQILDSIDTDADMDETSLKAVSFKNRLANLLFLLLCG